MALQTFESLHERYRLRATLRTLTGLRIGSAKSLDVASTDLPVVRDGLGRPYIPGSSLKGSLRSGLEALLRGLGHEALRACDPFRAPCIPPDPAPGSPPPDPTRELCTACGLFGSQHMAGRLFVHDLPLVSPEDARPQVRDGVGIERDLERARDGLKYDYEIVPVGVAFAMELLLENPDRTQLALVLKALELLGDGQILLGGFTSRGLGRVGLEQPSLERTTPERLLTGKGFELLGWAQAQAEASELLLRALERGAEV